LGTLAHHALVDGADRHGVHGWGESSLKRRVWVYHHVFAAGEGDARERQEAVWEGRA
jgi:hypothetical protein